MDKRDWIFLSIMLGALSVVLLVAYKFDVGMAAERRASAHPQPASKRIGPACVYKLEGGGYEIGDCK